MFNVSEFQFGHLHNFSPFRVVLGIKKEIYKMFRTVAGVSRHTLVFHKPELFSSQWSLIPWSGADAVLPWALILELGFP